MPGRNCAVVGCSYSRRTKGIEIFKLPKARNDDHAKWRADWLNILSKTRVVDLEFRRQIEEDNVYTCQNHFNVEDITECKYYNCP